MARRSRTGRRRTSGSCPPHARRNEAPGSRRGRSDRFRRCWRYRRGRAARRRARRRHRSAPHPARQPPALRAGTPPSTDGPRRRRYGAGRRRGTVARRAMDRLLLLLLLPHVARLLATLTLTRCLILTLLHVRLADDHGLRHVLHGAAGSQVLVHLLAVDLSGHAQSCRSENQPPCDDKNATLHAEASLRRRAVVGMPADEPPARRIATPVAQGKLRSANAAAL